MGLYVAMNYSLDSTKHSGSSRILVVALVGGPLLIVVAVIATVFIIKWRITREV